MKRFHGNIIGKSGANIKKIKEETGTQIDIPAENSGSDIIVVTGYKAQAEKARDMILKVQNELVRTLMLLLFPGQNCVYNFYIKGNSCLKNF